MRLGNPLYVSLNDITVADLRQGKYNSVLGGARGSTSSDKSLEQGKRGKRDSTSEAEGACKSEIGTPGHDGTDKDHPIQSVEPDSELTNKNAPFGGSLSLARVQSLVSMTTPRDGNQAGLIRTPPFVEFDLSIDGFACLFLPSVFPQSISQVRPTPMW